LKVHHLKKHDEYKQSVDNAKQVKKMTDYNLLLSRKPLLLILCCCYLGSFCKEELVCTFEKLEVNVRSVKADHFYFISKFKCMQWA